ncbi:MAG: hypothetical protein FJY11_04760 [Bacteroidetes bacterium]|nr:hypothetical protein [Bacteroidota bacterium]
MKKLIFVIMIAGVLASCKKDPDITGPTGLDLKVTSLGNNEFKFENLETRLTARWDFGNGQTAEGNLLNITYIFPGEYKVKATALLSGIELKDSLQVTVTGTRSDLLTSILNDTIYARLTGGLALANGKVWVWDSTRSAHLGVGQPDLFWPNWWAAPPKDKSGKNLYDDKLVFNIYNFRFSNQNNGFTYVKDYASKLLGDTVGRREQGGGSDYIMPYTPPAFTGFTVTRDNQGNSFIEFNEMAFPSFFTGAPYKYQVLKITDDELYLRHHYKANSDDPGLAWYFGFVREGYVPPLPPTRPYDVRDIHDNFQGGGNITWFSAEVSGFETVDNPLSDAVNSSSKVAKYTRGTGNHWENLQARLNHEMDLRNRNVFKLKVYMPSTNDYTTLDPNPIVDNKLTMSVSMKLQNSDIGEPWTTQAEIRLNVTEVNKWVELTFDFSGHDGGNTKLREDLDRIIIQIGGEGHLRGGVFYIDEIILL